MSLLHQGYMNKHLWWFGEVETLIKLIQAHDITM